MSVEKWKCIAISTSRAIYHCVVWRCRSRQPFLL